MIYVTGDTHGDFSRFSLRLFPAQQSMTKDDYVIVCGDFGIWDKSTKGRLRLERLNNRPFTTLFVEGNHSNYDILAGYPVINWNGGKAQFIKSSVIHLMRGQVYTISGKSFFTMGGAASVDISDGILSLDDPDFDAKCDELCDRHAMFRIDHLSWWKEELPCEDEYNEAVLNLEAHNWSVDYIVSHCAPSSIAKKICGEAFHQDALTDFFETVKDKCAFKYWLFGHYHANTQVENKYVLLYNQIVQLYLGNEG